jgi:integrase
VGADNARRLAPRTRERYGSIVRVYLLPEFGSTPVGKLARGDIKRWFAGLGCSPGTARKVQVVLSSILSEGVELGLLRENPAARLKMEASPRRAKVYLTDAEVRTLLEAIPSSRQADRVAVWLAAYSGLRACEQWALRWRDVDLSARALRVERTLTSEHGALIFRDAAKTEGSRRAVSLPAYVANLLAGLPRPADPDALVFTAPEGGPVRHELFRRRCSTQRGPRSRRQRRSSPGTTSGIRAHPC